MLMPIGRFSRATRLSVKSLRNYDESGLLPAAFVDPASGYRYYRVEQLARAEAIRFLRIVDMPLAMIAETLDNEHPATVLAKHLEALEARRDELDRLATQLRQRLDREDQPAMNTHVTVKATPATTAVSHRRLTTYPGIFDDIPAGFAKVMGFLTATGIDPAGAPFTIYHQVTDADTTGDIEMCVPVSPASGANEELAAGDGLQVVDIAPGAAATITHRGGYDDLSASYDAVARWIHERGHRIVGPHREVYLNSPTDTVEDDLLTEILFPIDPAEGS